MIEIKVESHSEVCSRFKLIVMCGGYNGAAEQLYVESAEGSEGERSLSLEVREAASLELIVYFVPKLLPGSKNSPIGDHKPFEAQISVERSGHHLYNATHPINAWGGAAIKLNVALC